MANLIPSGYNPYEPFSPFEARNLAAQAAETMRNNADLLRELNPDSLAADLMEAAADHNMDFVNEFDQMIKN